MTLRQTGAWAKRLAPAVQKSLRTGNWFYAKLAPVLGLAYALLLITPLPLLRAFYVCGALVLAISWLGAWGHVVNDLFDRDSDRRAGKPNRLASLRRWQRWLLATALAGAGLLPLLLVDSNAGRGVIVADCLLATWYAAPPVRLKERGLLGVATDATAVHLLPVVLLLLLFSASRVDPPIVFSAAAISWATCLGVRGILNHQIWDHHNDVRSATRTLATRIGIAPVRQAVRHAIFPAEIASFALLIAVVTRSAPATAAVVAAYVAFDWLRVRTWQLRLDPAPPTAGQYVPPADLYQAWFPVFLLLQLAARDPRYLALAGLHGLLFFTPLRTHARDLLALARDVLSAARTRHQRSAAAQIRPLSRSRPVIFVGSHFWTLNGVNVFAANLVRGLRRDGFDARLLLTEQDTDLVTINDPRLPLPADIPVEPLPVSRHAGWGAHWGAMVAHLEGCAPCIYIPNSDWRHSCVSPLLSDRVRIVGIVHSDDPLHYDHVRRLGSSWDAIVAVSRTVADKTIAIDQGFAPRVQVIPIGVNVADRWPERRPAARPLEIIYHGLFVQRQKRILDIPKIMASLGRRGVDARLTMVGGGAQANELQEACRSLAARGAVRFLPVQPNERILALLEESDAFIMTSEFEGMPNALLEAMGRGCVPVVTNVHSGIPEVVKDGSNGFLLPVGDVEAFADRLQFLASSPQRRCEMSRAAYDAVNGGRYRTVDMVREYEALFDRLLSARQAPDRYRRKRGLLSHPPPQVEGIGLFPVECKSLLDGVGAFPSAADAADFQEQLGRARRPDLRGRISEALERARAASISRIRDFRVVVGVPYWGLSGVNVFAAHLVRGLLRQGIAAELLLTEHATALVNMPDAPMPMPSDVPVSGLPVERWHDWGHHWGATIRYLERQAPCVYLPNYDWRHSCITPLLSDRVAVIGILHGDDPLHYDHVRRLGRYWNRTVAVSRRIAERVLELYPENAPRLVTIPYGVSIPLAAPARAPRDGGALRIIYHGVLNQRQKRILDLPRIVAGLVAAHVPVELTIAGGGPEEAQLRAECQDLAQTGRIRFLGVLANERILGLLEQNDVFIMTSGFEGLPNALLEAMGRGCIPVVTAIESGIPELVRHGVNGFLVPVGDVAAFTTCLTSLQREPELRDRLSQAAYHTVSQGAYRVDDMVAEYLSLFQRVVFEARSGRFRRPRGPINHPPAFVSGVSIFPVECPVATRLGAFPSPEHFRHFREELQLLREGRLPRPVRPVYRGLVRVAHRLRLT